MLAPSFTPAPALLLLAALVCVAIACAIGLLIQLKTTSSAATIRQPTAIRSWGYQLQDLDIDHAAASPFDLLVIDPSRDGSDQARYTVAELARLKRKPDGSRRQVFAYLSIGEAENYRSYWQPGWSNAPPAWLLGENPDWSGNYAVRFWHPAWQALMFGSPTACLDRILAAGFDGVYLDKCDVIDDAALTPFKARNLPAAMVAFIGALSRYAKARKPTFRVVMQNAEHLLESASLRACLDGIAREELFFGANGDQSPNKQRDIDDTSRHLASMTAQKKLALVVEYLDDAHKIARATAAASKRGLILHTAHPSRHLDRLDYDLLQP